MNHRPHITHLLCSMPQSSEHRAHLSIQRLYRQVFFLFVHCFAVLVVGSVLSAQDTSADSTSNASPAAVADTSVHDNVTTEGIAGVGAEMPQTEPEDDTLQARYGVFAHYAFSMHSADFPRMTGTVSCCSSFTGGTGSGAHLGMVIELPVNVHQLLALRLDYLRQGFAMTTPEATRIISGSSVQSGLFEHHLEGSVSGFGVEPLFILSPLPHWMFSVGGRVGLIVTSNYSQWEQLSQPSGVGTFMNADGSDSHSRVRNEFSGIVPNVNVQFAAVLGVSYELPMNRKKSWLLCPELYYHYSVSTVTSDLVWKAHVLSLGVALKYCPNAKKIVTREIHNEIDTLTVPLIADSNSTVLVEGIAQTIRDPSETSDEIHLRSGIRRTDTLFVTHTPDVVDATIRAVGLDSAKQEQASAVIRTEEFLSTEMTPLLPFVFFDHNSCVIPSRYQTSEASQRSVSYDLERLHSNRLEVYYQLLNILGMRMQQNPRAVVTLIGCTDNNDVEERNQNLARSRAEAIREYLTSAWNIPADRFRVEARGLPNIASNSTTSDGAAENRRVEISCNDFSIVSPVLHHDTLRSSNPPTVRVHMQASATRGIASWTLSVSQHGRTLKTWNGNGVPPEVIDWPLNVDQSASPSSGDQLEFACHVVDSLGKEKTVQTHISIDLVTVQKKRLERRGDKEVAHFGVNLFAVRHSDVSSLDRQVLMIVKQNIQKNSTINVFGFTDRSGDPTYNRNLAMSRAKSVAAELAPFKVAQTDVKSDAPIYDNDVPEGRFYSRTVEIEAETPVP